LCAGTLGDFSTSVVVGVHLALRQGERFDPRCLAKKPFRQPRTLPIFHGKAPAQIGQGESGLAVASVQGPQEGEQLDILVSELRHPSPAKTPEDLN